MHENLSWNNHINNIANKISKTIGILRHIKTYIPLNVLKTIYNSLAMPYLQYGILVWAFDCDKLEL